MMAGQIMLILGVFGFAFPETDLRDFGTRMWLAAIGAAMIVVGLATDRMVEACRISNPE